MLSAPMRNILAGGAKGVSLDLVNANKLGHLHAIDKDNKNNKNNKNNKDNKDDKDDKDDKDNKDNEREKRKRSLKLPFRRKRNTVDGINESIANIDINDINDMDINIDDINDNAKLGPGLNIMPVVDVGVDGAGADQPPQPQEQKPDVDDNTKTACTMALLSLFPDICPDFLQTTSERMRYEFEGIVSHLLDQLDDGKPYPHRQSLKRKRLSGGGGGSGVGSASASSRNNTAAALKGIEGSAHSSANIIAGLDGDDADAEADANANDIEERKEAYTQRAIAAFSTSARVNACSSKEYNKQACILLRQANIKVPQKYILSLLQQHRYCLLPSLLAFDEMLAKLDLHSGDQLPYKEKVRGTLVVSEYTLAELPTAIRREKSPVMRDILVEYELALHLRNSRRFWRQARVERANREAANHVQAELDGAVRECECCWADVPLNRTVHCASADTAHFFCTDCARRMAETQIGLGRFDLACMSTASCAASFSRAQRALFLSTKTAGALERIEQDYVLRVAGLEGLERCPFCPFAAEYPPVEANREFACQSPACEMVSCRLCRKETHIPMTCGEAQAARGERPSARLLVEEAMSRAMIRSCNKCATPFIKEHGCNKMTCTNAGCSNVQCYVCHKSCDYAHFDDTTRGGKKGNCPLFEDADQRHALEVQAAEAKARDEVVRANPGIDVSELQFTLAGKALDDDQRRQRRDRDAQEG